MSSHREAPEISKDPVADSTDVYAFVSPDRPDTVTLIANYIPLQEPDGGPNFYEFGDDVAYDIHISNKGRARPTSSTGSGSTPGPRPEDLPLQHRARSTASTTRPGTGRSSTRSPGSRTARRRCSPSTCPARRSTSVRAARRTTRPSPRQAVHTVGKRKVFAGQRADAFHVDLGSMFDLVRCARSTSLHLIRMPNAAGRQPPPGFNVHTIALQVPISEVSRNGACPTDPMQARTP